MERNDYSLAELCICAAARAWQEDGEVLASGIGVIPRLAAGLAMRTLNPSLMMTDGEAYLVREPVPLGPRNGHQPRVEGWMPYGRVFDLLYRGHRHAMTSPVQIDRWGQSNISFIGSDWRRPKVQLIGVRGFPGNTIHHANSMFVARHDRRCFVSGEVDMVAGVGYRPERWQAGWKAEHVDLRLIITNLCVMDFGGPEHAIRLVSLHPGVELAEVQDGTGFPLHLPQNIPHTPEPSAEQLEVIRSLDPHGLRDKALGGGG